MTVVFPFSRRQLAIHFLLGLFGWAMAVQAGWFAGQPSTFTSRFAPTVRDDGFRAWINPFIPWPVDVAWADVIEVAPDGRALKVVTGQGRVVRLPVALLADGSGLTRLVRERAGHSPGVDAGS
ncbi:MAG: hypothetical protein ACFCVC_02935 [Acidimicrobiia bacterium]